MELKDLPALNAILNSIATVLLVFGYYFIKKKKQIAHRNCMIGALTASSLFLISYLIYHYFAGRTVFTDPAWARPYYLVLLLTHTVLAVAILPLVIITFTFAIRVRFELHKKIARWTLPLWLYVSVTGVLIYFLLYHIWPQG